MSAVADIRPGARVAYRGVIGTVEGHPADGLVDLRVAEDQRHRFMDPPASSGPWLMDAFVAECSVVQAPPRDTLPDIATLLGGSVTRAPRRGVWLSEDSARRVAAEVVR